VAVIGAPLVSDAIDELQMVSGQISMGGQVVERIPIRPMAPETTRAVSAPPPMATTPVATSPIAAAPIAPAPVAAAPVASFSASAPAFAAPAPLVTAAASPATAPAAPASNPAGLFDRRRTPDAPAATSELHTLLDMPATLPKREWEAAPAPVGEGASAAPVWKWRVDSEVRRDARFAGLKTAGLAVLSMSVVLIAGGFAVTAQSTRVSPVKSSAVQNTAAVQNAAAVQTTAPAQNAAPTQNAAPAATAATVAHTSIAPMVSNPVPAAPTTAAATGQASAASSSDTWVVQVAAFSSHDRSQSLVRRLTQSGFPAFEVATEASRGLLYYVRVGPFKTAGEADEARGKLQSLTELENAFVRSVTSVP